MGKKRVEIDVDIADTGASYDPDNFSLPDRENFTADDVIADMKWDSKQSIINDLDLIDLASATIHVTVVDEETGEVTRGSW